MSRQGLTALSLFLTLGAAFGYDISPPIPVVNPAHGLRYMPAEPKPPVTLEIFIDINCPDSEAGWATLKPVQAHYGNTKLDLVMQQVPLPYHRNAFLCTQGMFAIEHSDVPSVRANLFAYIEESMHLWRNFSTASTVDLSETQVLQMVADMAVRTTGIDRTAFLAAIPNYNSNVRAAWKFSAKRGVAVAPSFFLNGVELGIGVAEPTQEDWIKFLDPIVLK